MSLGHSDTVRVEELSGPEFMDGEETKLLRLPRCMSNRSILVGVLATVRSQSDDGKMCQELALAAYPYTLPCRGQLPATTRELEHAGREVLGGKAGWLFVSG